MGSEKNDLSVIGINPGNVMSFAPYIAAEKRDGIRRENVGGLGLIKKGRRACGALLYSLYPEKKTALIDSIFIDVSLREMGFGTMLYEAFEEDVLSRGYLQTGVHIVLPADEEARCFFLEIGFDRETEGEVFYELTREGLKNWLALPRTAALKKKSDRVKGHDALRTDKIRSSEKSFLPGIRYDEKLSFVEEGKKNYVLADRDDDGNIIVLTYNLDWDDPVREFHFLEQVSRFYIEEISENGIIYITSVDEDSRRLISILAGNTRLRYSYSVDMAKSLADDIPEEFAVDESSFLIPRINGISRMLSDFGEEYSHEVYITSGSAVIELDRAFPKRPVSIYYEYDDTDPRTPYTLNLISGFGTSGLLEADRIKIDEWKKESTLVEVSEDEKEKMIYAKTSLVEGQGLSAPGSLKSVLDSFISEIDQLSAFEGKEA